MLTISDPPLRTGAARLSSLSQPRGEAMLEISPDKMAALAANASAALELLEDGVHSEGVLRGLAEGEEFCVFLERGAHARTKLESFSAAGLAAGEFVGLVLSTESGKELANKVDLVLQQVRHIRDRLSHGLMPKFKMAELVVLRDYFYSFARALAHQEALRYRLARDIESQH
jgi:hypothetical protein